MTVQRVFGVTLPTAAAVRLRSRCRELLGVLRAAATPNPTAEHARLRSRLLPNPYPEHAEAAEEFARLAGTDLADGKRERAASLVAAIEQAFSDLGAPLSDGIAAGGIPSSTPALSASGVGFQLTEQTAIDWLRTITDLRLSLADRLGITDDDEALRLETAAIRPGLEASREDYLFLAGLQEGLLAALQRTAEAD